MDVFNIILCGEGKFYFQDWLLKIYPSKYISSCTGNLAYWMMQYEGVYSFLDCTSIMACMVYYKSPCHFKSGSKRFLYLVLDEFLCLRQLKHYELASNLLTLKHTLEVMLRITACDRPIFHLKSKQITHTTKNWTLSERICQKPIAFYTNK